MVIFGAKGPPAPKSLFVDREADRTGPNGRPRRASDGHAGSVRGVVPIACSPPTIALVASVKRPRSPRKLTNSSIFVNFLMDGGEVVPQSSEVRRRQRLSTSMYVLRYILGTYYSDYRVAPGTRQATRPRHVGTCTAATRRDTGPTGLWSRHCVAAGRPQCADETQDHIRAVSSMRVVQNASRARESSELRRKRACRTRVTGLTRPPR